MNYLKQCAKQLNIDITEEQLEQFHLYYDMLIEKNKVMNLTAIIDKKEVMIKHFLDSIAVLKYMDLTDEKIIDIGTGAGFPGIPIKIIRPELELTLLDSLNKRINFLNEVVSKLHLQGVNAIHGRAEDYAHDRKYRGQFDVSVSRAVANLSTLSEYCIPFVKIGGYFISYKSGNMEEELENSKNSIYLCGGKCKKMEKFILPDSDMERSFVFIEKVRNTAKQYPRKSGIPSKNPL